MTKVTHTENTPPKCGKEWFRDWFNSTYYDLLYSHRDEEEARLFISSLLERLHLPKGSSILDLACGKGRHSVFLNELGYEVTGIDLSTNSIESAKSFENSKLRFKTADMRTFELDKQFECVMNLFTSFGYFEKTEDNLHVLQRVKKHLKPNGVFVLDYFNAEIVKKNNRENYTTDKQGVHFIIEKKIEGDFVVKSIEVKDEDFTGSFQERVQLLQLEQLEDMLRQNGLIPISRFGSYHLETFSPNHSERVIIIARN